MRRGRAVAIVLVVAVCAGFGVAILSHRSSGPTPKVMPMPAGVGVSLADAERRAPFVIYLPTALPPDAGPPRFMFVPELESRGEYLPSRVYVDYPDGITLWEMPSRGRPLARAFVPVQFGNRVGWGSDGPGPRRVSLEWIQGGTQVALVVRAARRCWMPTRPPGKGTLIVAAALRGAAAEAGLTQN